MEKFTAQAQTTEEAVAKALSVLAIDHEEADITVLQESKKGFLGIGQRDAIVQVEKKEKEDIMEEVLGFSRDNPPHKQYEEQQAQEQEASEKEEAEAVEETVPDTEDERRDHLTFFEEDLPIEQSEREVVEATPTDREDDSIFLEKELPVEKAEVKHEEQAEEGSLEEKHDRQDREAVESVRQYIIDIGEMMGATPLEVEVSYEDNRVHFDVSSEKAGIIIGRHGKVLNAIQSLAQIHLYNAAYSKLHAHVDIEGYRNRREQKVINVAKKVANKVAQTNQPEILESMSARERKIVHRYLSKNNKVETHSEGKDPNRYLVVEPVLDTHSTAEETD